MTRKIARELAIQLSFAASASGLAPEAMADEFFTEEHYSTLLSEDAMYIDRPDEKQLDYIHRLISLIHEHKSELDGYIERYSNGWKVERISRTAVAVMRCALAEILYMDDIPNAAAINEAVELCKGYDTPDVVALVNGILGGFMRGEMGGEKPEADGE